MYQIEKFKSKGLFGQRTPVDVANEWLKDKGNTIRVIATSPIFDDDGNLLELLITYEIDKLEEMTKKKSMFKFLTSKEKEAKKSSDTTTKEIIMVESKEEVIEDVKEEIVNEFTTNNLNNDDSNNSNN
ncbi:hypothetical protein [Fusobacterium sp. PH5-44]|uniref:hypothetical protein n=1 Tax=unclassified Fusobacterium TaxID=2648384 RepID=UPI003D22A780